MLFSWLVLGLAAIAAFVYRRVKKRPYEFPDGVCAFVLAAAVINALGHAGVNVDLPEAVVAAVLTGVSLAGFIIRRCLKKPHMFTDDVLANVVLFSVCTLVESLGDVPWIYTMLAVLGLWGIIMRRHRKKDIGTADYILGLVYMSASVMLLRGLFVLSVPAAVGMATAVLVAALVCYFLWPMFFRS